MAVKLFLGNVFLLEVYRFEGFSNQHKVMEWWTIIQIAVTSSDFKISRPLILPKIVSIIIFDFNHSYWLNYLIGQVYYAFQIAYYAFEQCFKIFPIMPQLCSIVPYYAPLCSIYNLIRVLLPESKDKRISLITQSYHLQFVKSSDCSIRIYRPASMEFWVFYLLILCSQKCWQNC